MLVILSTFLSLRYKHWRTGSDQNRHPPYQRLTPHKKLVRYISKILPATYKFKQLISRKCQNRFLVRAERILRNCVAFRKRTFSVLLLVFELLIKFAKANSDESSALSASTKEKTVSCNTVFSLVRAERIELSSFAWKADILAIIRRPHK